MGEGITLAGPQVCVMGVNYSITPISIREKLGIPKSKLDEAFASIRDYVPECVILATCNRTEIYALDDETHYAEQAIRRFLMEWSGSSEEELAKYLYCSRNYIAVRHLSRAAAGLYSMIIGEYEILGQVRQALDDAERAQMVNLPLRNLFQHAIRTGRRVREETDISKNALSVSSVAVDLATRVTGDVHNCRALLIGAGEAGKLVARSLSERGISQVAVTSRSVSSAQELASVLGGNYTDIDNMHSEMEIADIVITCTGAPHFIVHRELIERVMRSRPERPLVIVDIAVPRDVEPEVRQIEGVFMYDIDELNEASQVNRKDREKEIARAMEIVDDEMDRFVSWWQALESKPTISALMQMSEEIRQRQLSMTIKKLPPLSQEEHDSLDAMTKAIVSKLLHNPIKCLRENGHRDGQYVQTVREIFALDERGWE
ncbi:MAG: glutamyl-tRNA reductase [Chloroflexota bacterium]|nr:glutamyl-tRNA reductase [Chloroflexota bacterium]